MAGDITNGGPAYPYEIGFERGMSMRDYFAAAAMQALIAKIPLHDRTGEHGIHAPEIDDIHGVRCDIAQSAFDYADAMLATRVTA